MVDEAFTNYLVGVLDIAHEELVLVLYDTQSSRQRVHIQRHK